MPAEESLEEMKERYRKSAQEYFRKHKDGPAPPETTLQARQRFITLASLALLRVQRPDVHYFNELQLRYPRVGRWPAGDVVPDNMVVLYVGKLDVAAVFDLAEQPARPFWTLDYTSDEVERKSYDKSFEKYERALKVPNCLMFNTSTGELKLYRHNGREYDLVAPNISGRYSIPELGVQVGMLNDSVRFWLGSSLLMLPGEMRREIDELRQS